MAIAATDFYTLRWAMKELARILGHPSPEGCGFETLRSWLEARGGSQRPSVVPAAPAGKAERSSAEVSA